MAVHATMKCSHEENRKKVCVSCGLKITIGKNNFKKFQITAKIKELICEFLNPNFNEWDDRYPISICTRCRISLVQQKNDKLNRKLPKMPNFEKILIPKETRCSGKCNCLICQTARSKSHPNRRHRKTNNKNNKRNKKLSICETCLQVLGKGLPHRCVVSRSSKNAVHILNKTDIPNKQKEQVAVTIIKTKVDQQNINQPTFSERYKNVPVNLTTGGRKATVILNPTPNRSSPFFSEEHLDNLQTNEGFSGRQMEKITNFIRSSAGKKSIPSHYRQHRREKSKVLSECYNIGNFEMETTTAGKLPRPVVYADASQIFDKIVDERKAVVGEMCIKVVCDGGQNFFKVCLSIFPKSSSILEDHETFLDDDGYYSRSKYSEGGRVAKKGKLTGVKRIIILCMVPDIKETYNNISLLFKLINLNRLSFKFVSDFKILLIVNGLQTATSTYPCPYCHISLQEMRAYKSAAKELRTYGDLEIHFNKFNSSLDKNIKRAKECFNVINKPLFEENENVQVFQKCIIPELHLMQGFVNHLFWKGLVPLLGRENALKWPKNLNIIPKNYQGEIFEGNACRKLLKYANELTSKEVLGNVNQILVMPFVASFNVMNKIVDKCFGTTKTEAQLESDLKHLEAVLKDCGVSQTLKIHCILHHLQDSISYLNSGLGIWSEQAGESIHREFLTVWNKHKMNNIDDPRYGHQLLKAVVEFSSNRI